MKKYPNFHLKIFSLYFCGKNFSIITKTCLYNSDPLKPHFYIAKLGFTGVYIIFLISAQNIDCGYSLEPPHFLVVKISVYLNSRVFVMSEKSGHGRNTRESPRQISSSSCGGDAMMIKVKAVRRRPGWSTNMYHFNLDKI